MPVRCAPFILIRALLSAGVFVIPASAGAQADEARSSMASSAVIGVVGKRLTPDVAQPSTTVLDAAELRRRGGAGLEDLLADLPGVQAHPGEPGRSLPTLRGLGTTTSSELLGTQQATTGLYVDDVPLASPFGFSGTPDLTGFSLDRLEVLRGPQGALYGAASLGGAIHYVLGRPPRGGAGTRADLTLAAPATGGLGASVHVVRDAPLADGALALRVEAFQRREPGFVDNLGTGRSDANTLRREGARLALRAWPGGGSVVEATLLHQSLRQDDTDAVSPDPDSRVIHTPTASTRRDRFTLTRLRADTPLAPQLTLTSITAWHEQQARTQSDLTRSSGALGVAVGPLLGLGPLPPLPLVQGSSRQPQRGRAWSQEWRLASTADNGPRYVVGLFLQATRYDNDSRSVAPGGQALWGLAGFLLPDDEFGTLRIRGRTHEAALFGDLQVAGPAGSTFSLGGRAFRHGVAYDARLDLLGQTTQAAPSTREQGFTPRLALQLPLGAHTLHATVSEGYRFGGVNFNPPALTPYRSDRVRNHELGLQLRPGPAVKLDLTAFSIDWRDTQVSALVAGAVPVIGVANVGRARSRGIEASASWRGPSGLEVSAALAGIDARTRVAWTAEDGTPVPAGARLPGTPRWQTQLRLGQRFSALDGWQGQASLGHRWTGERVFDIEGRAAVPGYSRLDARLAFERGPWTVAAQIDNVANQRGVAGAQVVNRPGVARYTDWFLERPRRLSLNVGSAF